MSAYTQLTKCRCCGGADLKMYLDLGMMPLANQLAKTEIEARYAERYPLQVMYCNDCSLSQLSIVINPELMFSDYCYRSSINKGYVEHCRQMAIELKQKYNLTDKSQMLDIAGNDGALLNEFKKEIGLYCVNVDPAVNLAAINEALGIRVFTKFWGTETANLLQAFPKSDLITATNVIAHVHDVHDFLRAVKLRLSDTGVFVVEFPYIVDFIEKNEFDTVYFEHLSYFSIIPLMYAVTDAGMKIINITRHDIHGGTVRCEIVHESNNYPIDDSVDTFVHTEILNGFTSFEKYSHYLQAVTAAKDAYREGMGTLLKSNVAAFAASAKGNTLMNYCGLSYPVRYIVDETPEKLGKFTPGCAKPIISIQDMISIMPDYLVILSWNFAKEIADKCRVAGYTGKFIIPIPEWHEYIP